MKQRIITAIVMAVVGIPLLWLSFYEETSFILAIGASVVSLCVMFEVLRCQGKHKAWLFAIPLYLLSLGMPLLTLLYQEKHADYLMVFVMAIFLFVMYSFACAIFLKGKMVFSEVASVLTSSIYVVFCYSCIPLLRAVPNGEYFYLLAFIGPFVTDIFAYFTGVTLGRHKLIPEISPKKTIEGAIGGTLFGTLAFPLYGFVLAQVSSIPMSPNYLMLTLGGFLVAILSQIGDLVASWLKREYGVKDYGKIFPGHGGFMDRFDSVLPTAAILVFCCTAGGPFAIFWS